MTAVNATEKCPIVVDLITKGDALGLAKHTTHFCFHCLLKRAKEQFGGQELLYPDGAPPWMKTTNEAEKETSPEKEPPKPKKLKETEKNKKQKTRLIITDEEIDAHLYKRSFELSDNNLTYEIAKLKKMSKKAAHGFMIQLRQRAKAEKGDSPKKANDAKASNVNPPALLPWCPDAHSLIPRGVLSELSQSEQTRYLGICQNLMNSGSVRFVHNLKELRDFQKRADPERSYVESYVFDMIESNLESETSIHKDHPLSFVHNMARGFVLQRWKKRWSDHNFPKKFDCSSPVCSVEWKTQACFTEQDNLPNLVTTVLKGRHDRIQLPSLVRRCMLETSRLYNNYPTEASDSDRIIDDFDNITKMCLEYGARVAMDATTACHLMSEPFAGHEYSYAVPIRVVEKVVQGTTTNVAVLGKPRPLGAVEPVTIHRQFIKYLLKSTYVARKAEQKVERASEPLSKKPKVDSTAAQSDFCDPLDSILPSLETLPSPPGTSSAANFSENGRTYSVFSIIGSNVLVRSRPAPLCSEGHQSLKSMPLSFQPKVEYIPNAGAMRLLDAESGWNYCKEIFKQSANHALFRTHFKANHLLQIQHWASGSFRLSTGSEQQWTGPTTRQDARRMLSAHTTRFAKLVEEISHLPHGDYMLINRNDGVVKIVPQLDEHMDATDVLDGEKENIPLAEASVRIRDIFNGLEPTIPLQWQVVQSRAPGCYVAPDSKMKLLARTPLRGTSLPLGGSKEKSNNKQQKRENARKRKSQQFKGKRETSAPDVEMQEQDRASPVASSAEPASPAPNDMSDG